MDADAELIEVGLRADLPRDIDGEPAFWPSSHIGDDHLRLIRVVHAIVVGEQNVTAASRAPYPVEPEGVRVRPCVSKRVRKHKILLLTGGGTRDAICACRGCSGLANSVIQKTPPGRTRALRPGVLRAISGWIDEVLRH